MAEKRRDIFVDGMSLNRAPYFGLPDFLTQFSDLLKNPSMTFFKKKKFFLNNQHSRNIPRNSRRYVVKPADGQMIGI